MGQGVSLTALSAGSAGIDVEHLSDLSYEKSLGSARFMKCIRARHRHGLVVVKVVMKPLPDFDFDPYIEAIIRERRLLADIPNALGYQRVVRSDNNGYLVRQYFYSSLYDRMSTRPFLEDIEKKWLAFQLLCAVRDCHSKDVYHGDIKTENVLVTSWNWLYLTDFSSSYKQTYLPEDNPADFSYFFDTSGRRTCYVAPERFLSTGERDDGRGVTWAMDIFSVGCVIAELFTESPFFSLAQLFKYRKGEWDPQLSHLAKIEDLDIREMVAHMIQIEPEARYSADEYLNFWRHKAFPEYFYSFLHQYMGLMTDPSSGRSPVVPDTTNFGDADERIDRLYNDFDKISYFLGFEHDNISVPVPIHDTQPLPDSSNSKGKRSASTGDDGTLIFLTLVVSSLRNTARSTARLHACDLMLAFGERLTDEAKLDRVLPYVVGLLSDRSDAVKMTALRTMTQLLSSVNVVSPLNADVFSKYIIPRVHTMIEAPGWKTSAPVRATYATCLATLAHTSARILDIVQALRADGSIPTLDPEAEDGLATEAAYYNLFDVARLDLVDFFEAHTKALLTDSDASVRRAFLGSVSSLCVFFGSAKANDVILSHLNTYLNDKDWMLKCAFFQTIVGVALFVGGPSLEDFILPLTLQSLTDPEEFVVEKVLSSFASMAEVGLFQRSKTWEMVDIVARFMVHPNIWIKQAAVHFVCAAARHLSSADVQCIIMPLANPYLKYPVQSLTEIAILDALKRPLPRSVLEIAFTWATKYEKGLFWKPFQNQRTFSFGGADQGLPTISSKDLDFRCLRRLPKNDEDEQWLNRLRNLGMTSEDEFKLIALRDYINRVAIKRPSEAKEDAKANLNVILKLEDMKVSRQTIFFEEQKKPKKSSRRVSSTGQSSERATRAPHTIADALLDASTTIDDPVGSRRKPTSSSNVIKGRQNGDSKGLPLPIDYKNLVRPSGTASPASSSPGTRDSSVHPPKSDTRQPRAGLNQGAIGSKGEDLLLPNDLRKTSISRDVSPRGMRHKSSAINLLRRETGKSSAETGTTTTNAIARIDGPFIQELADDRPPSSGGRSGHSPSPSSHLNGGHTYDGHDPSVQKLLDDLAIENYPSDIADYGPLITPIRKSRALPPKVDPQHIEGPWHPQGTLVATFSEHAGPINRILPSPDHVFFLTASDDGSVKIWDTLRLERNLAHRSKHTHKHAEGTQVKCICFVENTHTFISCATDGGVHIVKVDVAHTNETSKYGKLQLMREYALPKGEHAVWCEHYRGGTSSDAANKSVLVLATNKSRVLAIDIRFMTLLSIFENPVHHGSPTCFVLDRKHQWLLLGTSHGLLDLWDMRFHLHLKTFGFPGGTPVHRLALHPYKVHARWVCVAGGTGATDVSIWDLEKGICKEVFSAAGEGILDAAPKEVLRAYTPTTTTETSSPKMLARFATAPGMPEADNDMQDLASDRSNSLDLGTRCLCIGLDALDDGREARYGFFLTGGADRKVRFWDLSRVENSGVVSGLDVDEPKPVYLSNQLGATLTMHVEHVGDAAPAKEGKKGNGPGPKKGKGESAESGDKGHKQRPLRSTVISRQQQALLRRHLDVVLDVAFLGFPVEMVVSGDRAGVINVFR